MAITVKFTDGVGPVPGKSLAQFTVEFSGPAETITINVLVPNTGTQEEREVQARKRAATLARLFAAEVAE